MFSRYKRNYKPRNNRSNKIGRKGAQSLYYAFEQAERIGFPLNCHVTIDFASTHCDPTQAVQTFSRIRRSFKTWARANRFEPTGAYAFENVRNGVPFKAIGPDEEHNVHVHWPVHIPASLICVFERELYKWIDCATGGITDSEFVVKITRPDKITLRTYILKRTDEVWASTYGAFAQPQGVIVGRRTGTTHNIGPKARRLRDAEVGKIRALPRLPYARRARDKEASKLFSYTPSF